MKTESPTTLTNLVSTPILERNFKTSLFIQETLQHNHILFPTKNIT
ncbi:MAG TPA: hypothetical protein PLO64_07585 [Methanothermobacter sp.]|nr:hypothetical protein [Methanothermobacter sp.]HPQ05138.1 hypothetical protein [Methanothermobacter sp.]HPU36451.1 hypothetical protein [Methanothermobacter sp.]